ncbi:MAG: M48 family metalloprotease [Desulfurococcaceae archaeon]
MPIIWFYDPLTMISVIIAYIIGFIVLTTAAGVLAPRVARKVAGKYTLQASMAILGTITVIAGLASIGLLTYILASMFGMGFINYLPAILVFVVILNMISYLFSPMMINIAYGARPDTRLQEIVNNLSISLGFSKPPKAVVVRGPPNAFAYGNFLTGKYVAVSQELINITTEDELRAIIGHELGHHKHRDNAIMLFMGLLPSLLYFLGISMIRVGLLMSTAMLSSRDRGRGGGGPLVALIGVIAIAISFLLQILVLAFSRLREYYADSVGAMLAGRRSMQRALARLHVYYNRNTWAREIAVNSKIKALFIYAFTQAVANPFYHYTPPRSFDTRGIDIDRVVEELKKMETSDVSEFFSTHPAIPKRIRFIDTLVIKY